MASSNLVFIGIKGSVVALDRATGTQVWATSLKGHEFVNVAFFDDELYAAAKGELYCLDSATGQVRWHNLLKGYGWGLMTIAANGIQGNQMAMLEKRKREQRAAVAAAAAG